MRIFIAAAALVMAATPVLAQSKAELSCATPVWRPLYHHDKDGKALSGSKEALFGAIRRGDSVRLVWGGIFPDQTGKEVSVEHYADPVFISIHSGKEVVAQLPEHMLQASYFDPGVADFHASGKLLWRAVMSTDGTFSATVIDGTKGEVMRPLPQRASIHWLAFAPDPACDTRKPLTLAVRDGVVKDEAKAAQKAAQQPVQQPAQPTPAKPAGQ
ncbi:MAG TPA: hypothetical protein VED40_04565 [Azospirillaceae bacterium]|nr:hypothetical protein [Azospirillaceae bacterium]